MKDLFKTFKLKFKNRERFNLALAWAILNKNFDIRILDVSYSDMIFAFENEDARKNAISILSVHLLFDVPNLKGEADFEIIED